MKKILVLLAASAPLGGCMAMVTPDGNVQTALLVPPVETVEVYHYQPVPPVPVWIAHRPHVYRVAPRPYRVTPRPHRVAPRPHRVAPSPRRPIARPTPSGKNVRPNPQYKPAKPRAEQPRHKPGTSGSRSKPKKR